MKKLFVCALAVGLFTACSQDETLSVQSPMQISFEGAFVENATRAAIDPSTTNTGDMALAAFDVWAFMTDAEGNVGEVFNSEDVKKADSKWNYANTAMWLPSKTYNFAALAPMNSAQVTELNFAKEAVSGKVLKSFTFKNLNGSEDLLYATFAKQTPATITEDPGAVKFNFNHLLSKVKFTFTNGFTNPNYVIKVTGLTMDASLTATYDLTGESNDKGVWTSHSSLSTNLDFGTIASIAEGASEECAQERLTFPTVATKEYTVNIKAELWIGDVLGKSIEKTAKINNLELEQGKAYNFTAEFNASNFVSDKEEEEGIVNYPIVFEANVIDWVDAEIGILGVGGEITENYTMITDASASSMITLADDKEFDGAGHTLTIGGEAKDFYTGQTLRLMQTKGDATISNLTIDGENTVYTFDGDNDGVVDNYGIRGIFLTGEGTVTLDNVTIKNVTYTLNDDASAKTLKVINSYLEGWTSYNPATEGIFEKVTFAKGTYGQFRPHGNATLTECVFNNDVVLDLTKLNAEKVVKLVNCKYGDTVITAENIVSLLGTNLKGYAADKVAF